TTSASTPAIVALAAVRNTGLTSSTATLVAGSEPLNSTMPIKPFTHPFVVCSVPFPIPFFVIVCDFSAKYGKSRNKRYPAPACPFHLFYYMKRWKPILLIFYLI